MDTKICQECLEEKADTEFNYRNKRRGSRQFYCRDCTREQLRLHYQAHPIYYAQKARRRKVRIQREQREWIINYLLIHPCVDCGEGDPRCLDFDHVRGEKCGDVSRMIGNFAWEAIEKEIEKCEVRCANCHRKRTIERREIWQKTWVIARP